MAIPKDLPEPDRKDIHAAFMSRGYEDVHSIASVLSAVSQFEVLLVLADPVELDVLTRTAAEHLWVAGIPFGTNIGNTPTLILPRRAIPSARAVLAGFVADADWRE